MLMFIGEISPRLAYISNRLSNGLGRFVWHLCVIKILLMPIATFDWDCGIENVWNVDECEQNFDPDFHWYLFQW
jgi:hypothetical protein